MNEIDITSLLQKIGSQPPYFSFKKISLDKTQSVLISKISPEIPLENELGFISAAEVGRHLAILGASHLALLNSDSKKHFYLASGAEYKANFAMVEKDFSVLNLEAIAKSSFIDKRRGQSIAQLNKNNEKFADLLIDYQVFNEKLFYKLFKKKDFLLKTQPTLLHNPYKTLVPLQQQFLSDDKRSMSFSIGQVLPEQCLGHFPEVGALPIAILVHALLRSCGRLLKIISKKDLIKYFVKEVKLSAPNLSLVGDEIIINVIFLNQDRQNYYFECKAIANGKKIVGQILATITIP